MDNEGLFNIFSKGIGMLPIPGAGLVSTALGLGSSIYDAIFGGTKREIDPEVKKRLLKQESMADKLKMQSENQEAVAQQQKTDVRQNMEGALEATGRKAANTYQSDSSIPMSAILTAIRSQAPISSAITQGITGATTEAENRKAQLSEQAGQMYGQIAQETEQLTREYPKTSAWDTTMKGMGASGLYSQMFKDDPTKTTGKIPNSTVREPDNLLNVNNNELSPLEFKDNMRTLDLKETMPDYSFDKNQEQLQEDELSPIRLLNIKELLPWSLRLSGRRS